MLTPPLSSPSRLLRDTSGVAMVEFALTLPVLLLLVLGGIEVTNLAVAHLKVNQVATTTADNAARVSSKMDETDLDEIFVGAKTAGEAIGLEDKGRVILSSVQDNGKSGTAKGQMINWQRCFGKATGKPPKYGREGKGRSDAALKDGVGKTRKIKAQPGTAVMLVEVAYTYDPMFFAAVTGGPIDINYETAFNVRERTELGITNTKGRPVKSC
ncbi:pilus assembly protein [Sphingomonas piscis]|uniref:Pilus assembly protein n=1 Tax=Sphingomonas piscis TaxID=2714943 RepID=A0A6G7YM99_9SPHN|nr:TadE/TadG family type IV pilus assembly protein [Sphingomonas piscis]QIK77875.1 pilus assembly protein [Sphingomonas piscis]